MSHEIRTPMNGVYASLQLLNRYEMPFEQRELVNQSLFSCECLLTIINDILDFSKIESGKLDIEKVTFSIRNIAESVLSDILPLVDKNRVSLTLTTSSNLWDYWLGDPVRTKQIILNIASNAIKFTKEGEILIQLTPINEQNTASGFTVKIKDTGIGMSKDTIDNLFHRFSQADTSTTRKYGGTGLGMSITQSLVALMGGELLVNSEEGIGSEFLVQLPLDKGKEQDAKPSIPDIITCPNLEHKTILVADDNPINRVIFKKALSPSRANIIEVDDGEKALEMAQKHQPDLVFMDIQMPIMDGITSFRMLKEKGFENPIIAFTANVLKHDTESYLKEGFNGCLPKPIDIDGLYALLSNYTS